MTLRALLRADPIPVRVGPLHVTVKAAWADEWLIALESGSLLEVVPGMLEDSERFGVTSALLSGAVSDEDAAAAARDAITAAAGRPWYEVLRLVAYSAAGGGSTLAALVMEGVQPGRVTIGLWCAALEAFMSPRLSEMDRMRFMADLKMPPGGSPRDVRGFDSVQLER